MEKNNWKLEIVLTVLIIIGVAIMMIGMFAPLSPEKIHISKIINTKTDGVTNYIVTNDGLTLFTGNFGMYSQIVNCGSGDVLIHSTLFGRTYLDSIVNCGSKL